MGKVGSMASGMQQMEATMVERQFPHFTQSFSKRYTFTAKTDGVIGLSVSSQFYARRPKGLQAVLYRNKKMIGYVTSDREAPGLSAFSPKVKGDIFEVLVNLSAPTSGDYGTDYWISAMTNEPIEFAET